MPRNGGGLAGIGRLRCRPWANATRAGVGYTWPNGRKSPLPQRRDELACSDFLGWFDDMDAIRESFARLLHCQAADIAFVSSAAAGLAMLVQGLEWRAGDEVLT